MAPCDEDLRTISTFKATILESLKKCFAEVFELPDSQNKSGLALWKATWLHPKFKGSYFKKRDGLQVFYALFIVITVLGVQCKL